ncbi:VOC family protein [bacterium]|nr:VOC family protein [bacterium]
MEIDSYLKDAPDFIESVCKEALGLGLDVYTLEIDHFCLRVSSDEEYKIYTQQLSTRGTLLSEALINGRPISTFKLHKAIKTLDKEIFCIEVPFPKENSPYPLGLEHIECVTPTPLAEFISQFPNLNFDTRAMNKNLNPEVALKLPSGNSVKFHNQSLEKVIEIENRLGL